MKKTRVSCWTTLACSVTLTACPGNDANDGIDDDLVVIDDADADLPDDDGGQACEPVTTCSVNECGEVDDGCNGTLDCGECACVDGVATDPVCGLCGFGERTCAANESGAGTCSVPGFGDLGFETAPDCGRIIYVDPAASAGGNGSPTSPYGSLTQALSGTTSGTIALAKGTLSLSSPLELGGGVNVLGGFVRSGEGDSVWIYDPSGESKTLITVDYPTENADIIGIAAIDVATPTVLGNVELVVGNGRDAKRTDPILSGGSSVGLLAIRSPGLVVLNSDLTAGQGGLGADGGNGVDGAHGVDGEDGTPSQNPRIDDSGHYPPDRIAVPKGAINPLCNASAGPSAGGDAGRAGGACNDAGRPFGCNFGLSGWSAAYPVTDGQAAEGDLGGAGGGSFDDGIHEYPLTNGYIAGDGESGRTSEAIAFHGAGGVASGEISSNPEGLESVWIPRGDGRKGRTGVNGGGGGGGGSFEYIAPTDAYWYWGAQGGSGGSGGCGGAGGFGGGSGGASLGAVLIDSNMSFINTSIQSRLGGIGGEGGTGGQGGRGGQGGMGNSNLEVYDYTSMIQSVSAYGAQSGWGGWGGAGTAGGNGGSGAGGDSYGIYCQNSTPTLDSSSATNGGSASGGGGSSRGQNGNSEDTASCGL